MSFGALLRQRKWTILIGTTLGGFAFWLALRGVPLREVGDALLQADPIYLAATAVLFLFQQLLRSFRQMVILRATHPHVGLRSSLSVLCIGFFFINTLPARMGEVVRPLLLLERENVPLGTGFALLVTERLVDLLAMFMMLASLAWIVPIPVEGLRIGGELVDLQALIQTAAGFGIPTILVSATATFFAGRPLYLRLRPLLANSTRPLLRRYATRLLQFLDGFTVALGSLSNPGRLLSVLTLSALTWGLTATMYPALARAFSLEPWIGYPEGIGALGLTMAGLALPSAPGFAGTYEAFLKAALNLFGIAGEAPAPGGRYTLEAAALAYALTMHWWVHLVQSATAIYFLVVDRIDPRKVLAALAGQPTQVTIDATTTRAPEAPFP